MRDIITETDGVKMDKCVLCEAETPYTEHTHIDYRNFYVEGCGQLCGECWDKVYSDKSNKDNLLLG
jgi:hypothetical protein